MLARKAVTLVNVSTTSVICPFCFLYGAARIMNHLSRSGKALSSAIELGGRPISDGSSLSTSDAARLKQVTVKSLRITMMGTSTALTNSMKSTAFESSVSTPLSERWELVQVPRGTKGSVVIGLALKQCTACG